MAVACTPKKAKDPEPAPTEIGDTILADSSPTAKNSLDYLGVYKGKFPCRDCPAAEITLELSEDFNYILARKYPNTQKQVETKGTFRWDATGNWIVLSGTAKPSEFRVYENRIVPRTDLDGNRLKGKQTQGYEMFRLSEAEAVKTEAPADRLPPKLTGIHWKLSEINSKPVTPAGNRDYFLQLNKDGSFGAFAGCNSMGGKYEFKGSKVRMFNIISTMMACAEMKTEDDFRMALETSDNFVANEKVFQLRKGGRNLLKFEAVTLPEP